MEHTFMRSFCMISNLRTMLSNVSVPAVLRDLLRLIEDAIPSSRGICDGLGLTSNQPSVTHREEFHPLPSAVYQALLRRLAADNTLAGESAYRDIDSGATSPSEVLNPNAHVLASVMHKGRRLSDAAHHVGDSHVSFCHAADNDRRRQTATFGQIQMLFVHNRRARSGGFQRQVFAAVKVYPSLSAADAALDPYRSVEGADARLVYSELSSDIQVIPLDDIVAHFVTCPYRAMGAISLSRPCVAVLSVQEV
ncbi:hypothetical protein OH77DRAFT_1414519 [Trametes cingulata]|nr:hypothetical protein OH77DRAFT_1414519 [Trametes cingulata]